MQTKDDPQSTNPNPITTLREPKASRWNIRRDASLCIGACVGHVHFMSFLSISFALGSQRERDFWWNTDFDVVT